MFYSTQIGVFVHLLDVIIKVGKYFPIISVSLTSLNVLMAVNSFLANNIGFVILNSLFAASGLIFLVQMNQMKKSNNSFNHEKIHTISGKMMK
jgi:hypothetical protein